MKIDTFLTIGKTHKVCEDYILSGTEPFPFIILSDGCSSSKGTDMGSRLLCYLAKQYIKFRGSSEKFYPDHIEMGLWIIHNAELVAKQLGLSKNSLDATLIIAYQLKDGFKRVRVHIYGDGCILTFTEKGYSLGEINYSKNAPYYLSYVIDPERDKLFYEMKQNKSIKTWHKYRDGFKVNETIFPYDGDSVYTYDLSIVKGLLISSDGLTSFNSSEGPVSFDLYADEFFAFKTTAGEFLKRRAMRVLKDLAKEGIHNADDLSIGVFLMEDK